MQQLERRGVEIGWISIEPPAPLGGHRQSVGTGAEDQGLSGNGRSVRAGGLLCWQQPVVADRVIEGPAERLVLRGRARLSARRGGRWGRRGQHGRRAHRARTRHQRQPHPEDRGTSREQSLSTHMTPQSSAVVRDPASGRVRWRRLAGAERWIPSPAIRTDSPYGSRRRKGRPAGPPSRRAVRRRGPSPHQSQASRRRARLQAG